MIRYTSDRGAVHAEMIDGFFVGWPVAPSAQQLIQVMDGSYRRVWALEDERVVGYINAISDGVLNAFLPWLEVHPHYQGRGIGTELVRQIMEQLDGMYAIDVCCDPELLPYYERLGLRAIAGAAHRNQAALRVTRTEN